MTTEFIIGVISMNTSPTKTGYGIGLWIGLMAIFFFLLILGPGEGEGACISGSITEAEFEVDNSDGLISAAFEPDLTITNDCEREKNIEISTTIPNGRDTGQTKNIYPHIFSDKNRRKDHGTTYRVQLDPGETKFYPLIEVNFSAFADVYTFKIRLDNKDDKEQTFIEVTVTVTGFNDIKIEFLEKEDKERRVTAGRATIISVRLTNQGNIFEEEIGLSIEDLPGNLSLIEILFPPKGTGIENHINPQSYEEASDIILGVKLEADRYSCDGIFDIDIYVVTPDNDPPASGHSFVRSTIIVKGHPDCVPKYKPVVEPTDIGGSDPDDLQHMKYFYVELLEIFVALMLTLWWRTKRLDMN